MIQQLISRIRDDDNPRLHRTPFFLMWVASYALGWFVLHAYERLSLHPRLCDFYHWLRGTHNYNYFPTGDWWREDLFVGALFGLLLSFVQTWLLRQRYGYVPKFWRIATFIGALVAGFGYPRVGLAAHPPRNTSLILDFLIWFSVLGLFQMTVMFRANRQAWRIALVGFASSSIAIAIYHFGIVGASSAKIGLLAGILIQVIGTGMVMMHLMANPREDIVPKRESSEKSKVRVHDGLHPITFVALWTGAYFTAQLLRRLMWELFDVTWNILFQKRFSSWLYYSSNPVRDIWWIVFFIIVGIISGIAQKWLMQKYGKITIRHWILFSAIGWGIAGFCLARFRYGSYYSPRELRLAWFATYFIIPSLFQALAMLRSIPRGWFWIATGFVAAIVALLIPLPYYSTYATHALLLGDLALSLSTAATFLVLQHLSQKQQNQVLNINSN